MTDPDQPATESPSAVPPAGESFAGQPLAPLPARLIGAIIDGVIVAGIAAIASLALSMFGFPSLFKPTFLGSVLWALISFGIYAGINYNLLLKGQTVGKVVMGTRILRLNDQFLPVPELLAKRLAPILLIGLIPFIGGLICLVGVLLIFRADRRCLHDLIADTKVVVAGPQSPS